MKRSFTVRQSIYGLIGTLGLYILAFWIFMTMGPGQRMPWVAVPVFGAAVVLIVLQCSKGWEFSETDITYRRFGKAVRTVPVEDIASVKTSMGTMGPTMTRGSVNYYFVGKDGETIFKVPAGPIYTNGELLQRYVQVGWGNK